MKKNDDIYPHNKGDEGRLCWEYVSLSFLAQLATTFDSLLRFTILYVQLQNTKIPEYWKFFITIWPQKLNLSSFYMTVQPDLNRYDTTYSLHLFA